MALSGIQIYKLLPQTNCKECGFPTCLAFAMKLAAKQVELSGCPYVSEESKTQLAESSAPPVRLITLKGVGTEIKVGNEVCLYRHEKTFFNKTGVFVRIKSSQPDIAATVAKADAFKVVYVGMDFTLDGFAVEADDPAKFADAVKAVRSATKRPLILISKDPNVLKAGTAALPGETPLLAGADSTNWEGMAALAAQSKAALAVSADSLDALVDIVEKVKSKGVEDIVLDPAGKNLAELLSRSSQIRRLALKNFRSLGYPIITYPCTCRRSRPRINDGSTIRGEICRFCGIGQILSRVALCLACPQREYLHRSTETHPGDTGHLRDQCTKGRKSRPRNHQLQHHVFLSGQRNGKLRAARPIACGGCGRHVGPYCLGGRKIRCRADCQGRQGIRCRKQNFQEADRHPRACGGPFRRTGRGTCPDGKSGSDLAKQSICRRLSSRH